MFWVVVNDWQNPRKYAGSRVSHDMFLLMNRRFGSFPKSFIAMDLGNIIFLSCTKSTWDTDCAAWTDGRNNQQLYKDAVDGWRLSKILCTIKSTILSVELGAIALKSQLLGQATGLCRELNSTELRNENSLKVIVNGIIYLSFLKRFTDLAC